MFCLYFPFIFLWNKNYSWSLIAFKILSKIVLANPVAITIIVTFQSVRIFVVNPVIRNVITQAYRVNIAPSIALPIELEITVASINVLIHTNCTKFFLIRSNSLIIIIYKSIKGFSCYIYFIAHFNINYCL